MNMYKWWIIKVLKGTFSNLILCSNPCSDLDYHSLQLGHKRTENSVDSEETGGDGKYEVVPVRGCKRTWDIWTSMCIVAVFIIAKKLN